MSALDEILQIADRFIDLPLVEAASMLTLFAAQVEAGSNPRAQLLQIAGCALALIDQLDRLDGAAAR